jgi:Transglutaminase-like superfamily
LFCAWISLRIVPFRWTWRVVGAPRAGLRDAPGMQEIERIGRAIRRAAARVPRATCLTRGLAAALLLRLAGLPHELFIGVRKDADGTFAAHAWVVSRGTIVAGNLPDLATYTPMPIGAAIPRLP